MLKTYLYGLHAPGDETIMYIGQSHHPRKRLAEYIAAGKKETHPTPVKRWIKSLLDSGELPVMKILEIADTKRHQREAELIEEYRKLNPNLTNCIHISQVIKQLGVRPQAGKRLKRE